MKRWLIAGAVTYALIAVVTFGHAAANASREERAEYAECRARADAICFNEAAVRSVMGGALSAALWPLYWSWEAWS